MKRLGVGLLLLALAGCQMATGARFEQSMKTMIGKPETALLQRFGVPDATYSAGGNNYLSYRKISVGPDTLYCTIDWRVTAGVVKGWRYEGNACEL